ncbi:MAG: class II aldolase/adducin family protein [Oscillospiraceae bacterium]|nr:class II aldolase/adducin family protein [Oscillospiraceae bacterium]
MFSSEKRAIIKAGITLDRYGLIALSGGNVSLRTQSGEVLVTPSGMVYEEMAEDDVVVMSLEGEVISGGRKPSSDTEGILYILQKRPDLNAVIHTHQPYATAISLLQDEFAVSLTTLANAAGGNVKVSPYSSPGSVDMGIDTVNYLGESLAVILAHHGVNAVGKSLKQALYAAVYLEEAARCYLAACAVGPTRSMTDAQARQAIEVFKFYGQETAAIPKELLKKV